MHGFDQVEDLSGLNCPMPILRTKAAFAKLDSGKILKVIITNPDSVKELHTYAQQMGHHILESSESAGKSIFWIEKA